jgi:hypothetical protein
MLSIKPTDHDMSSQDLPLELRRAWTVHRNEDRHPGPMLTGLVDSPEQEEVISPYLSRQNLVIPAFPFRAASPSVHLHR